MSRKKEIEPEAYKFMPWARTVLRLTPGEQQRKTLQRWYKSKKCKEIFGTDGARWRRQAFRHALKEEV